MPNAEAVLRPTRLMPENGHHLSALTMAEFARVRRMRVQQISASHGFKPHLIHKSKLFNDPRFEEKLVDVEGFIWSLPYKDLVLCVDGKSHIQDLVRTPRITATKLVLVSHAGT